MNIDSSLLQLLMEIGYLAAGRGLTGAAERIFTGVQAVRPESSYPAISMAIARINAGDFTTAAQYLLEEVAAGRPDNDLSKAFLGMALHLNGMNHESSQILAEVIDNNQDPVAVELAKGLTKSS